MKEGEIFWRSRRRAYTRQELESRQVARQRGLLILELLSENPMDFTPSRIATILRGGAPGEDWRIPELKARPQWGKLSCVKYDDLLMDVLSMWAKGYIAPGEGDSRRLALSQKGRAVLMERKGDATVWLPFPSAPSGPP